MKQSLYKITIQMCAGVTIGPDVAFQIAKALTHKNKSERILDAIEEFEDSNLELLFRSDILPCEMLETAKEILYKRPDQIYSIDLVYTYPYDVTPDRVTLWSDGRVQEYKTRLVYEEIE